MDSNRFDQQLHQKAAEAARDAGCTLVDVRFRGSGRRGRLEVTIDRPGGVSVDDCARVSRRLGEALDEELAASFTGPYVLEVGSPGLTRPLRTLEDYACFAGRLARVELREAIAGVRRYRGRIIAVEGESVTLEDERDGRPVNLPWATIARGNLDFDPGARPDREVAS